MPRPKPLEPKIRLSLELPESSKERLVRLVKRTEALSYTEVIRVALQRYEASLDAQGKD